MRARADGPDLGWSDTDRRAVDRTRELPRGSGVAASVVSRPCAEWFAEQDDGASVGLEHVGASAEYRKLYAEFGVTAERAARAAHASLATVTPAGGRR